MKLKNIFWGLLGISLVVTVHELGHWTFCKAFNVDTPRFSIGFGPVLAEKKLGDTIFTISALPIGGFVEIGGMRTVQPGREATSFVTKPYRQKFLIMLGGIMFNIIFAFIIFMTVGFAPRRKITPETEIEPQETTQKKQDDIIGPLGIIALASRSASYGKSFYFFFLAILSLNLALFNLFPIPILDGGQLLLVTMETVHGTPITASSYNMIMTITTLLMMMLFFYATGRDIRRTAG